ncbi:VP9 [Mangshi virus]|nr:VP9 [Mangshi virus]
MISSTQLRALKKGSREISRVPGDDTINLPSNSILSKGEVEKLCSTKAESKALITLGSAQDAATFRAAFGGDLVRTNLFMTLMFNNILFHTNNVVARTGYPWLPNIARSMVTAWQVRPPGGIPFAYLTAGTQVSAYNARVTSLLVTYCDILHSETISPNTVYVHYQTTLTSPGASTPTYVAQYCSIPADKWNPSSVLITTQGTSRGVEDLQAVLNTIDASERGIPGGLVVNIPGVTVTTSTTQTSIPVTTVPAATRLIFASAVRNTEEYELINLLFAAGLKPIV